MCARKGSTSDTRVFDLPRNTLDIVTLHVVDDHSREAYVYGIGRAVPAIELLSHIKVLDRSLRHEDAKQIRCTTVDRDESELMEVHSNISAFGYILWPPYARQGGRYIAILSPNYMFIGHTLANEVHLLQMLMRHSTTLARTVMSYCDPPITLTFESSSCSCPRHHCYSTMCSRSRKRQKKIVVTR